VFTNVSDTPDVEEVVLGPAGVVHGARPGMVVVDNSTISPSVTRRIAEILRAKGVEMLDAPVSGGQQGAIDGTLSVMVGGTAATFERALPLLRSIGRNIVHVGDSGAGQVAKACNQVVIAQTVAAIAEGLLLATAAGVDPAKVREALLGGFAASRALEVHGQRMLDRNYAPGFVARLHQKDMRIVLETAQELGLPLPGAERVTQYIDALVGRGDGELDSAALATVLEGWRASRSGRVGLSVAQASPHVVDEGEEVVEPVACDVAQDGVVDGLIAVDEHVAKARHVAQRRCQRLGNPVGLHQQIEQLPVGRGLPSRSSDAMCEATSSAA